MLFHSVKLTQCADINSAGCLSKNQFDERKCSHLVDALYECCAELYMRKGQDAKSVCCPSKPLLQLKISQRRKEQGDAELKETKRR